MDRLVLILFIVAATLTGTCGADSKTPPTDIAREGTTNRGTNPAADTKNQNERNDCFAACEPSYKRCSAECSPVKDDSNKTGCYSGCDWGFVGCLKRCETK